MKSGFFGRLINRLDKLDQESLQAHFLHLAQERGLIETIFQSIQEGIIAIDGAGKLRYSNKAAENLLGFSFESARNRPIGRYIRGVDWDRVLKLDAAEWSKLMSHEIEITYPEHRFVNFYVVPLSLESKEEEGAVVILRDVTHDRQHEASLLESERINAVKLLAAGVAHEIGNPLNALNIHLQLLQREIRSLPEEHRNELGGLVEVATAETARLDMIITQFLRAIRPARPRLALSQVDGLLNETLQVLKLDLQNRNIRVEIECPPGLPRIRVDRGQIKQAFFNIIKNALQAMPDGGTLTIAASVSDRFLALSFRDSGQGIQPEDFGRIFEPYYSTKTSGSGLGLMVVQRIVQDHGGQIRVVSEPGHGTDFTILLPLAERRVRLLPKAQGGEAQPKGEGHGGETDHPDRG